MEAVVARARVVLDMLEKGDREGGGAKADLIDDLPLFSATPVPTPTVNETPAAITRLSEIHPDELTPREALALIYELKGLAES